MRNIGAAERMFDGLSNETQKLLQTYVKEVYNDTRTVESIS